MMTFQCVTMLLKIISLDFRLVSNGRRREKFKCNRGFIDLKCKDLVEPNLEVNSQYYTSTHKTFKTNLCLN